MSMPTNPPAPVPFIPPAAVPRAPRRVRHALGLPAGSVRAILGLAVMGLLALIVLQPGYKEKEVPSLYVYLWAIAFVMIAHFFASHGKNIGVPEVHSSSPLGLPRGSVRFILLLGFGGIAFWLYHTGRMFAEMPSMQPAMLVVIPIGFFAGWLISVVLRGLSRTHEEPYWFQDIEAWVAIVAMLMLMGAFVIHLFINPGLEDQHRLDLSQWEGVMAALVAFYFGARS